MSACSTKPDIAKTTPAIASDSLWQERQEKLKNLNVWEIAGRLGVKTSDDAWSASMKWQHSNDDSRLRIIAPFHGTYEIKQNGMQYSLLTPDDEILTTRRPEQLMLENVGWSLPIRSLIYWVKGIPDASFEIKQQLYNDESQLIALQQKDWLIKFSNYKSVKNYFLPGKIILSSQHATITLLNKDWKLIQ